MPDSSGKTARAEVTARVAKARRQVDRDRADAQAARSLRPAGIGDLGDGQCPGCTPAAEPGGELIHDRACPAIRRPARRPAPRSLAEPVADCPVCGEARLVSDFTSPGGQTFVSCSWCRSRPRVAPMKPAPPPPTRTGRRKSGMTAGIYDL